MSAMSTAHAHPSSEVQQAAKAAVKEVFFILGVDVNDPKSVGEFQADLRFSSNLRRATNKGIMSAVGVFTVAICYALWHGIQLALRK